MTVCEETMIDMKQVMNSGSGKSGLESKLCAVKILAFGPER